MALPNVLQAEIDRIWSTISRATAASLHDDSRTIRRAITNISAWCNMTPEQWAKREMAAAAVEPWVQEVQANSWKTSNAEERAHTGALLAHLTAFETVLEDVEPSSMAMSLGLASR
jgi:hypothetical protein